LAVPALPQRQPDREARHPVRPPAGYRLPQPEQGRPTAPARPKKGQADCRIWMQKQSQPP